MERDSKLNVKLIAIAQPLRVPEHTLYRRWIVLAWQNLEFVVLASGRDLNVYCRVSKLETCTSGPRFSSATYSV
jgi:hypothetical protein